MWSPYAEPVPPESPCVEPVPVSSPYRGHRSGLYGLPWLETVGRVVRPSMRARTGSRWLVRVRRSRLGMSRPIRARAISFARVRARTGISGPGWAARTGIFGP